MNKQKSILIYLCILFTGFVIYIWQQNVRYLHRYDIYFDNDTRKQCEQWCQSTQVFQITTRITTKPEVNTYQYSFNAGEVKVFTKAAEVLGLGDTITLSGNLEKRVTDSRIIQYRLMNPTIALNEDISQKHILSWPKIVSFLGGITDSIWDRLQDLFDYPYAGLIAGILFGISVHVPNDFYNALINTGTVHIIAASGYNVTFLTSFSLQFWLRLCRRKVALWLTFVCLVIYILMAGASEALLRAGIMGSLYLVAMGRGREYRGLWALLVTVIVMLGLKPELLQSISFQLSVSATFGILVIAPMLQKVFFEGRSSKYFVYVPRWMRSAFGLVWTDLCTTLSAIIATLPIILITFDSFNLISILANVMVLWTIAPMMVLSMVALGLVWMMPAVLPLVGWLVYPYAWWFVRAIEICNQSTRLKISDLHLSWWFGFGYYLVMLAILLKIKIKADT